METIGTLIRTKLRLPFTRQGLVPRPRLQSRISEGLCGPLTLVTAPAGFGKTTLVASSVAGSGMPTAWLSLDKNDNQASRFLSYLVAALQEADHSIGRGADELAASQQAPPEAVITSLINDLDGRGEELVLVLDDYQFINSQAVHEQVALLLERCPNRFHVVIAARSDPPLPLARLRGRGQTVELRAADLCFTEPETGQFLNDIMGLHLDAGSVAVLEERTEGWIAGLQMAALSMRNRRDIFGFIEGFSGTNRYILDYLLEEVLANQSPEIQRFLLCTSILERLTAPLCDAVLQDGETGKWMSRDQSTSLPIYQYTSQSILEYVERSNLFLMPLDDERIWYRYHHLFADLLRTRLDQLYPGLAPRLHGRAAAWLESEGMTVEAVNHALAAGAHDRAARLVEENTIRLLAEGEMNALLAWIEMLPVELRPTRPWLCIHQAYALAMAGRPVEVAPLLAQAEAALAAAPDETTTSPVGQADKTHALSMSMAQVQAIKGAVAAVRAFTAVITGQDAEALSYVRQAQELMTAEDLFDQSLVAWASGKAMLTQGRLSEARLAFEEQIRLGRAMGHIWTLSAGLTYRAQALQAQGQLRHARADLEEALTEAGRQRAGSRGFMGWVEDGLACVLYEQNELEAANRLLAEAITLSRWYPNPNHLVYAHVLQARILLAQGDLQAARLPIGEADRIRRSAPLTRWLRRTVEADLVRGWLALAAAGAGLAEDPLAEQASILIAAWRSELASMPEGNSILTDECAEISALTLARVSLAADRVGEARALLEPLAQSAQAAGHIDAVIRSLVLTAIACQAEASGFRPETGQSGPALAALEGALRLAEPGGYVRVFLDEGQPVQMLLARWLAHAGASPLRDYAGRLLSQFDAEPHRVSAADEKVFPSRHFSAGLGQALVEPLTPRELEVLQLICAGDSNQAIADKLVITVGTVKKHTGNVYSKLDVTSRAQAIVKAREFGLLPEDD